jgi:phosphotransferase system enzyme I (PtsI)
MFPMVTTLEEVRRAKEFVERAKIELTAQKVKFDENLPIGVMIEIPAAAMIADQMAAEVDFLSIGSNDLIQYLLAVDRGNSLVSELYKEFHPCVVLTLKHVIDAAHKHDIWIGLCGEMAGNPLATALLVGLGIDELSVVPAVLPEIKKIIRSLDYKEAKRVAKKALSLTTCDEVEEHLVNFIRKEIPDIPLDEGGL